MIQIDMPMPTNCFDCPACNEYLMCAIPVSGRKWGENDVRDYRQRRPNWCPMKEQEKPKMHIGEKVISVAMPETVRCKNCRFYEVWTLDPPRGNCTLHHKVRVADWFCADGERKEE